MSEENKIPEDEAVYVISVASQLSGLHPQTLRQYDRLGLVSPNRTVGKNRRYSLIDIVKLRNVQRLVGEGINLAGIARIMQLDPSYQAEMPVQLQNHLEIQPLSEQLLVDELPPLADDTEFQISNVLR